MSIFNRRKFFKKTLGKCLPIIGAIVAASLPIKADSIPSGCNDCSTQCHNTCKGECYFACTGSCYRGCTGCGAGCDGSCARTCRELCAIDCTATCSHTAYK